MAEKKRQKYRLLVGIHIGPDYTKEPVKIVHPETGVVTLKYPSRTFEKGEVFESEYDLLQMGEEKFALAGREHQETYNPGKLETPSGAVSTGLQETTGSGGSHYKEPEDPEQLPAKPPNADTKGHETPVPPRPAPPTAMGRPQDLGQRKAGK